MFCEEVYTSSLSTSVLHLLRDSCMVALISRNAPYKPLKHCFTFKGVHFNIIQRDALNRGISGPAFIQLNITSVCLLSEENMQYRAERKR